MDNLTLVLLGDVSLSDFDTAVGHFHGLLSGLAREIATPTVDWVIDDLEPGSARVAVMASPQTDRDEADKIVRAYAEVGESLSEGRDLLFAPQVVREANALVRLIRTGITALQFETPETVSIVTPNGSPTQQALPKTFSAFGGVRGRVQTLSNRGSLRFTLARPYAAEGCAVLVWHPSGENAAEFRDALLAAKVHILKQIIWVKPTLIFGRHEYHWRHENAMYGWFEGSRARFFGKRSETTVWEVAPSPEFKVRNGPAMKGGGLGEHPTQKPVELTTKPIGNHTLEGEAIYEPFAGSGSALIAAEQTGRRCLAMEIDPTYCDVIVRRWEEFAGQKAVLESG